MRAKTIIREAVALMRKEVSKHQHGETNTDAQVLTSIELLVDKLSEFADVEASVTVEKPSGKAR